MDLPNRAKDPGAQQALEYLASFFQVCRGNPNGQVRGAVGTACLNLLGGANTTLWVKESGEGTATGWVAK
jgi:hypothetical protein